MHKIISPYQSTFIPGRWIAENQVLVHELLHSFKTRKVKSSFMAIKLDLQKAYDRFNWKFIHVVLTKLGFNYVFINWILTCISSLSFEVLVNEGKSDQFKPSRGLGQDDPLSSYLFILGQDILSKMLDKKLCVGNISSAKANSRGPALMHVMYTDDIVLFSKATRKDAKRLALCLEKYCKWSGQAINRGKSSILFSKHTGPNCRKVIKQHIHMKSLKKDLVYFGSPLFRTRSPSKDFKFLQERLETKLLG